MKEPLVSLLMTSYNRSKYISESIENIINQTYTNWELIVVDDSSKDDTAAIASKYAKIDSRIRVYINEKNFGDYPNRNRAAKYANGKYIKYVDSDDIFYPHAIQVFVWGMEQYPSAVIGISEGHDSYEIRYPVLKTPKEVYKAFYEKGHFLHQGPGGLIFNREVFFNEGGFSGQNYLGDTEFLLKMCAKYPIVHIPPFLFWWRTHEGQQIKEGNQNNYYQEHAEKLLISALFSECSPLEVDERNTILKRRNRQNRINIFKAFVKRIIK